MHNVNTFFPQFVQKIKKSVRKAQKYYDINIKISILTNPKHYAIINNILLNLIIGGQNRSPRMAGTKAGGMKAAATNKAKYGKEFYARIGKKGGQNGHTGGFAANPELARIAGAKGGRISRRGPAKKA